LGRAGAGAGLLAPRLWRDGLLDAPTILYRLLIGIPGGLGRLLLVAPTVVGLLDRPGLTVLVSPGRRRPRPVLRHPRTVGVLLRTNTQTTGLLLPSRLLGTPASGLVLVG
jgi:hypothetical protein